MYVCVCVYFTSFLTQTKFPASTFVLPSKCTATDPVGFYCNSTDRDGINRMNVYNFHDAEVTSLTNQDVGDVIGDAYFM
jgi:hypothetical protein